MTFFDYLKNIFFILIFLQLAPGIITVIQKQYGSYLTPSSKVGVISIAGQISKSDKYNKLINKYFKDDSIKAILLKIESPGGASGSAQLIYNEIKQLKKEYSKPIITLVENICTSASYYIAAATDLIIAPPSALIGSIGTSFPYMFQLQELMNNYKVNHIPLVAGDFKNATNPLVPMTNENKTMLQSLLNDSYHKFISDVALSRNLNKKEHKKWANGQIFTGQQALALGLVDKIGSGYEAEKIIKDKALIEDQVEWIKEKQKKGLLGFLSQNETGDNESIYSLLTSKIYTALHNFKIG